MFSICTKNGETESHPKNVPNIKLFINRYKRNGINYPSKIGKHDWKTFEKNNATIALNILYIKQQKKKYVQLISQKLIRIL